MDAGKTLDQIEQPTATAAFLTNTRLKIRTGKGSDYGYVTRVIRNTSNIKPKPLCAFCKESHSSVNCTKVPDYNARMLIVKRDRLCFNCLGHHSLSASKSTKTCNKCKKRHHTSICKDNGQTDENNKTTGDVNVGTIQHNGKESDTVLHSQSLGHVLLKTAVNPVSAGHDIQDANILFDEGAQRSFITQELAEKLKLKPTGTESVNLSGFGDTADTTKVRHLKTGLIYLMTKESKLPIRVLIVPEIAAPMRTYVRQAANLAYLSGVKLAHPITADETLKFQF